MDKVTAGRDAMSKFAPKFAELNDDVLFGEVWSREDQLSPRDRSLITVSALMASGILDTSLLHHIQRAKANGVTATEMSEALTQQASPAYLAYLQERGVSYLFAGKERLDCALLLQKLYRQFGIDKLMLAGGGIVNGSFLAEGLVDEFSLVVAPVADGGSGVASFAQADFLPHWPPAAFHLKSAQTPQPDVLWLCYTKA